MSMILILLACVFVGLSASAYVYLQEMSRRKAAEQAIRAVTSTPAGRNILRGSHDPSAGESLKDKVLKRAPSVWAKDATSQTRLLHAGYDSATAPLAYSLARVVTLVALPLLAVLFVPRTTFNQTLMAVGGAAALAFLLPSAWLARAARKRQERVRRSLPDSLDLLVVCVEAGISLDAAILRVAREMHTAHPELANELAIVSRKTNAGMRRDEALRGLWERTGVDEVRTLVASLIQSEKWGSSSARVLRIASETLRRKRRQSAEKRAATAPNKMTIPLATLIFPALFVVILGPAFINITAAFGPGQ